MFNHHTPPRNDTRRTVAYPSGQGARGVDPREQNLWTAIGMQKGQWAKLRITINATFQKDLVVRLQGLCPVPTNDPEDLDNVIGPPQTTPNPLPTHLVQIAAPFTLKERTSASVTSARNTASGLSVPQNYLSITNPNRPNPASRNPESFNLQQLVYLVPPRDATRPFMVDGVQPSVTVKKGTRVRVVDYLTPTGHQLPGGSLRRPTNYKVEACIEATATRMVDCRHWISPAFLEPLSPDESANRERLFRSQIQQKKEFHVVSYEEQ